MFDFYIVAFMKRCIVPVAKTMHKVPRWAFMELWKQEVRPGAQEESASLVWLYNSKCSYLQ